MGQEGGGIMSVTEKRRGMGESCSEPEYLREARLGNRKSGDRRKGVFVFAGKRRSR